jgi:hypothetical protein
MTVKERLLYEIELAPESLAPQLLSFLHLLQSESSSLVFDPDENPFKSVDGFMVIKEQGLFPEIDWVSLVRAERINELVWN